MILADKIIENRKKNGWSQEELADKLNVSRQSVSKWEGAQAIPDMKKILQMAELFGVTTDYLLKDDIEDEVATLSSNIDYAKEDKTVRVSMEEASNFLNYNEKAASPISLGVMLCITCAVPLLLLIAFAQGYKSSISEHAVTMVGIIILLLMIACAVTIFIFVSAKGNAYKYLEDKDIDTDYGVSGMAKEARSKYEGTYTRSIVIGVVLCIISAIPLFFFMINNYTTTNSLAIYGVAALLMMVGIGIKIIVKAAMINNGYNKLLEEGDYTRLNKKASKWDSIYWSIATAIYLAWSFISGSWQTTWIVWPIAGVAFAAYKEIIRTIIRTKN